MRREPRRACRWHRPRGSARASQPGAAAPLRRRRGASVSRRAGGHAGRSTRARPRDVRGACRRRVAGRAQGRGCGPAGKPAPSSRALRGETRRSSLQLHVMEERGYVAEALLERLHLEGIECRLIGESRELPERAPEELELAVPRTALGELPRLIARFAHDFDLRLVQLYRPGRAAWRAVVTWSDEVGRPRFMAARFFVGAEEGTTPE